MKIEITLNLAEIDYAVKEHVSRMGYKIQKMNKTVDSDGKLVSMTFEVIYDNSDSYDVK